MTIKQRFLKFFFKAIHNVCRICFYGVFLMFVITMSYVVITKGVEIKNIASITKSNCGFFFFIVFVTEALFYHGANMARRDYSKIIKEINKQNQQKEKV